MILRLVAMSVVPPHFSTPDTLSPRDSSMWSGIRAAYVEWCQFCEHIAETYDDLKARAVDVERGIYHMVTRGCLDDAADIIAST